MSSQLSRRPNVVKERAPRDVAIARPRAEEVDATANVRGLIPSIHANIIRRTGVFLVIIFFQTAITQLW